MPTDISGEDLKNLRGAYLRLEKDRQIYLEMSALRKLPGFDRLVECYCLCLFKETSTEKSEKVVGPANVSKRLQMFQTRARASDRCSRQPSVSKEVLS